MRHSPSACGLLGPQPGDPGCTALLPFDLIATFEGEQVTVPFGLRESVGPWDVVHASGRQGPATCTHQGGAWSTGWVSLEGEGSRAQQAASRSRWMGGIDDIVRPDARRVVPAGCERGQQGVVTAGEPCETERQVADFHPRVPYVSSSLLLT